LKSTLRLGQILFDQGKSDDANNIYSKLLAAREKVHGPNSPQLAYFLHFFASSNLDVGKYKEAEALFQRALSILTPEIEAKNPSEKKTPEDFQFDALVAEINIELCHMYEEMERKTEAEECWTKSLDILKVIPAYQTPVSHNKFLTVVFCKFELILSEEKKFIPRYKIIVKRGPTPNFPKDAVLEVTMDNEGESAEPIVMTIPMALNEKQYVIESPVLPFVKQNNYLVNLVLYADKEKTKKVTRLRQLARSPIDTRNLGEKEMRNLLMQSYQSLKPKSAPTGSAPHDEFAPQEEEEQEYD